MCDTLLALPNSTARHISLFGKNSDRQRNEAQAVEVFRRAEYQSGTALKCTYISIPQVRSTNAVLLCRPFWMWGAEMGANEHGVAIGNEAVFSRVAPPRNAALTGMDLLRLALERADSAKEAVDVITSLLEKHGQGGDCGYLHESYYHNSFLISDTREGFVLETVGQEWLVERVRDIRAISNAYSIDRTPERLSGGLLKLVHAVDGSTKSEPQYAVALADPEKQHIGSAEARQKCAQSLLTSHGGQLNAADMMKILRNHGLAEVHHPGWNSECITRKSLCLHAGDDERSGQTVGSMVSELSGSDPVHWVTGTGSPCLSIFKPLLINAAVASHGARPTGRFDPRALWWRHERIHRLAVMGDFAKLLEDICPERDALESDFRSRITSVLNGGSISDRELAVTECWNKASDMEDQWFARASRRCNVGASGYRDTWLKMNRMAGMADDF
jgi:secernin